MKRREFLALLQQSSASGSRSTVMQDSLRIFGICIGGLALLLLVGAPTWTLILVAVFAVVALSLNCWAYVYFAVKSPDALRSESFTNERLTDPKEKDRAELLRMTDGVQRAIAQEFPDKAKGKKWLN